MNKTVIQIVKLEGKDVLYKRVGKRGVPSLRVERKRISALKLQLDKCHMGACMRRMTDGKIVWKLKMRGEK